MSRITFRTLLALFALALMAAVPAVAGAKRGSHHHNRSAKKADRNRDGLPDSWERRNHLSLRVNQAGRDQDRDGADNAAEFTANTNPRDRDSDDDGVKDGDEAIIGTVVSFENGTLIISSGGMPVTGKVTDRTEIKCEGDHGDDGDHHGDGGHSSSRGDDDDDHGDDDHTAGAAPTIGGMTTNAGSPAPPLPACSTSDLKPGALVHEAELKLTSTGPPVWDEIKLVRPVLTTP